MRPKGTVPELERRRRRAVELVEQGESPAVVARILGVHITSIHRWRRMARTPHGLDPKPIPGRPRRLSDYHLHKLERLLLQGAHKHGWPNQLWTADRVARLIQQRFGLSFHPEHVRKILKERLGWTSQKPRRKARERDDKEVERWLGDELPRIVREAYRRKAHVVFLDESGFQRTPSVRRTLAPRGQTPVLDCWDRRDRISAIRCLTLSPLLGRPGLYFELLPVNKTVHGEEIVAFLSALRRELRGPFTVAWDRSKIHSRVEGSEGVVGRASAGGGGGFSGIRSDVEPGRVGVELDEVRSVEQPGCVARRGVVGPHRHGSHRSEIPTQNVECVHR
jgi:transposase